MSDRLDAKKRRAQAHFFSRLNRIVGNLDGLSVGDDRVDYIVPVQASRLHAVSQQIAALRVEVEDMFGVSISVMPVATNDRLK